MSRPIDKRKKPTPAWVVALCVACGVVMIGCLYGAVTLIDGYPRPQLMPLMPREDFNRLAIGKTAEELIRDLGRPDSTSSGSRSNSHWYYAWKTIDPVTGKADSSAQVVIDYRTGKCVAVNY